MLMTQANSGRPAWTRCGLGGQAKQRTIIRSKASPSDPQSDPPNRSDPEPWRTRLTTELEAQVSQQGGGVLRASLTSPPAPVTEGRYVGGLKLAPRTALPRALGPAHPRTSHDLGPLCAKPEP